ncbi:hypothetical protein AB0134_27575, partial [Klebsiella pneumoniae]
RMTAAAQALVERVYTFDALARYVIKETLALGPVARHAPPSAGEALVKAEPGQRQPSMNYSARPGPWAVRSQRDESGRPWPSGLTAPTMRAARLT